MKGRADQINNQPVRLPSLFLIGADRWAKNGIFANKQQKAVDRECGDLW